MNAILIMIIVLASLLWLASTREEREKLLCFDMDGTIVDLYGVSNWESRLKAEDETPYVEAKPMVPMQEVRPILETLKKQGWKICVVTWGAKNASHEYNKKVGIAKMSWLIQQGFPVSRFFFMNYGENKSNILSSFGKSPRAILIDDNPDCRKTWGCQTIDPTQCDLIVELKKLIA